jgi:hypothetical protein
MTSVTPQGVEHVKSLVNKTGGTKPPSSKEAETELFEQIGRLKMEPEWLKKTRLANVTGVGRC